MPGEQKHQPFIFTSEQASKNSALGRERKEGRKEGGEEGMEGGRERKQEGAASSRRMCYMLCVSRICTTFQL